jgi:hypothetical protein
MKWLKVCYGKRIVINNIKAKKTNKKGWSKACLRKTRGCCSMTKKYSGKEREREREGSDKQHKTTKLGNI